MTSLKDGFVGGIKESELADVCVEINKYSDNIADIFSRIDDEFAKLPEVYKSESLSTLLDSYNDFRKNYPIVKSNINSYSDDLTELISKMRSGLLDIEHLFDAYTEGIKTKTKAIK